MNQVRVNESSLVDIAEAIREKSGKSNTYTPSEMGDAVRELPTRIPITESITITANGTYEAPAEIDGYSEVIAQVAPNNTTIEITSNGSYTTPAGYDGISEVIVNTPTPPAEAFVITGKCANRFSNGGWDWFIENYGNQITTKDITNANYMFSSSEVTTIPFELNFNNQVTAIDTEYLFAFCSNLESIPKLNNINAYKLGNMFDTCENLRTIPEDIETWFNWSALDSQTSPFSGSRQRQFRDCKSLRSVPMGFLNHGNPVSYYSYAIYYGLFTNCWVLDEVVGLPNPHPNAEWTSDAFSSAFSKCLRLKNMTFATPNGQPYVVKWKNQMIDLSSVGWLGTNNYPYQLTSNNSGITEDKLVTNDAGYQALKDDPDWFTNNAPYCRYNHDSAVATINSLPDTSAYLATAGGTNTIKFYGSAGSKTDGGAISNLTEEEIAVATAKGWTVSLV